MGKADDRKPEAEGDPPPRTATIAAERPLSQLTDTSSSRGSVDGVAMVGSDSEWTGPRSLPDTDAGAPQDRGGDIEPNFGSSDTLLAADQGDADTAPAVNPTPIIPGTKEVSGGAMVGRSIAGRFTILRELGRGGMSEVYVARHELLQKEVAIKVLRQELAANTSALERFHREAIAAANVGDPGIVEVTDFGYTERGEPYLAMELLDGRDLRSAIKSDGAFSLGRAVAIVRQILRALRAAHDQGIVHRDLKAENIFLIQRDGADFVKILDFGISKLRRTGMAEEGDQGATALTSTGMVMGTPQYIAPEQAYAQSDIDQRADIYAIGVILYEMITGGLPFSGRSALELMMKHVQDKPQPPSKRRPDLAIPADLERVVLKALEKEREDRFDSAQKMLDALPRSDELTGGYTSMSITAFDKRLAPLSRRRWPLLLAVFALLAGSALIGVGLFAPGLLTGEGTAGSGGSGFGALGGHRSDGATAIRPEATVLDGRSPGPVDGGAADRGAIDLSKEQGIPPEYAASPQRDAATAVPGFRQVVEVVPRLGIITASDGRRFKGRAVLRVRAGARIRLRIWAPGFRKMRTEFKADPKIPRRVLRLSRLPKTGSRESGHGKGPEGRDLKENPYTQIQKKP